MKKFEISGFAWIATITLVMIYILGTIFFAREKITEQHDFEFETYKFTMITAPAGTTVYQRYTLPNRQMELEPVCMITSAAGFSLERVDGTHAKCKAEATKVPLQAFVLKH